MSGFANQALTAIARGVAPHIQAEGSSALFEELSTSERDAVQHRMATRSVPYPQQVIAEGRFLEFAPRKALLRFFEEHPELFFDAKHWDQAYTTLDYGNQAATEEAQAHIVRYYASLLTDAIWLAEQDPGDLAIASRAKLLRAAMALELLSRDTKSEA